MNGAPSSNPSNPSNEKKGFAHKPRKLVDRLYLSRFIKSYDEEVIEPLIDRINEEMQYRADLHNALAQFAMKTGDQTDALDKLWVVRFERFTRRLVRRLTTLPTLPTKAKATKAKETRHD